jgi:hypothetical protein
MRSRLTYANVMVTILAFVVLGGVAVAGVHALKKNSVGTKQLKNGAVTTAKIKNGAVGGPKLSPSALSGYAKTSDLSGFLKAPIGPDQLGPLAAAGLGKPIYNVGGGGVDCQGANGDEFPNAKLDDIDFESVEFDSGGVAHTEPPAAPNCYNGFSVPRAGKYLVTAWIDWETDSNGSREIAINAQLPSKACCQVLAIDSQAAVTGPPTAMSVSAIAQLPAGASVFVQGPQSSGAPLKFAGGAVQIAWLGN